MDTPFPHTDPAQDGNDAAPTTDDPAAFVPVVLQPRRHGWTADRQRRFIATLAATGCVSAAAHEVGLTPHSAYRLRARADAGAFAAAWDDALYVATNRLVALAFERAVNGIPRTIWRGDEIVGETRQPSERLMIFLLTHLMPGRFGGQPLLNRQYDNRPARAQAMLPARLDALADSDCPADPLGLSDYQATKPLDEQ
jgi:hypothetical protein